MEYGWAYGENNSEYKDLVKTMDKLLTKVEAYDECLGFVTEKLNVASTKSATEELVSYYRRFQKWKSPYELELMNTALNKLIERYTNLIEAVDSYFTTLIEREPHGILRELVESYMLKSVNIIGLSRDLQGMIEIALKSE